MGTISSSVTATSAAACRLAADAGERAAHFEIRHRVFVEEMGGRPGPVAGAPAGHDVDLFDDFCEHLLVRDDASGQVIGTYRVLTPAQARRVGSTYSDTEFDLTRLRDLRERMVELGRSCVHPDHRQGGVILDRVEWLRVRLAIYEWRLRAIRRPSGGRAPSVAWDFLVAEQAQRGLSDEEVMKSLVRVGHIADQEINKLLLQENIKKHRQRRKARLNERDRA